MVWTGQICTATTLFRRSNRPSGRPKHTSTSRWYVRRINRMASLSPLTVSPVRVSVPSNQPSAEHRRASSGSYSSPSLRTSQSRRLTLPVDDSLPIHISLFHPIPSMAGSSTKVPPNCMQGRIVYAHPCGMLLRSNTRSLQASLLEDGWEATLRIPWPDILAVILLQGEEFGGEH